MKNILLPEILPTYNIKNIFIILYLCVSSFTYSYANSTTCNLNAGGEQSYCSPVDIIGLYGDESGINYSSVFWEVINQPSGSNVIFENEYSLQTFVTQTLTDEFPVGEYTFVISGICVETNELKQDTVIHTVYDVPSEIIITNEEGDIITEDTLQVCHSIHFEGSEGEGETGVWTFRDDYPHKYHMIDIDENSIDFSVGPGSECLYYTFFYTLQNTGCAIKDSIVVHFEAGSSSFEIIGGDQVICDDEVFIRSSGSNCNSDISWEFIPKNGTPASPLPSVTGGSNEQPKVTFPISGTYDIVAILNSYGVCPDDTVTVEYTVCSEANLNSAGYSFSYCEVFPDTIFLDRYIDDSYEYSDWVLYNYDNSFAEVIQTGPGTAYVLVHDQTVIYYRFGIEISTNECGALSDVLCNARITEGHWRSFYFEEDLDTLNILCPSITDAYLPIDILPLEEITYYGYLPNQISFISVSVPEGCTNIVEGLTYEHDSELVFICEGFYEFLGTIYNSNCPNDTVQFFVNVADILDPNAGTNASFEICTPDTIPLVGNQPIDNSGNVNTYVQTLWRQVDELPSVTFLGSPSNQIIDVTDFTEVGIYMFEYSFSREENCYLADTMIVQVDSCSPCPILALNCCELLGLNDDGFIDPVITTLLNDYWSNRSQTVADSLDPCCNICEFPTDSFQVFLTDTSGFLLNTADYQITWSHDEGNDQPISYIHPNQYIIVEVSSSIGSCEWTDTLFYQCCEEDISIDALCDWDPCDSNLQHIPIPFGVVDQDSNQLDNPDLVYSWSNGSESSVTSVLFDSLPISVMVNDTFTNCTYTDTFDINCCKPTIPENLTCRLTRGGVILSWDAVPDVDSYQLVIKYNDPTCCKGDGIMTSEEIEVQTNSYTFYGSVCFSWKVRSDCTDEQSAWSQTACSCGRVEIDIDIGDPDTECEVLPPDQLNCVIKEDGRLLSWNAMSDASFYEISILENDPGCCETSQDMVTETIEPIYGLDFFVDKDKYECFSWKVRSVCKKDGTRSDWSEKKCMCITIPDLRESQIVPSISVSPNPTSSRILVQLKGEIKEDITLTIYDIFKQPVITKQIGRIQSEYIDLSNLRVGTYTYTIITANQIIASDKISIIR